MTIPFWRDVSVVLLVVEAFILALIPLGVLYFVNRGLQRLRAFLRPIFRRTRARVQQVERVTFQVSELIVTPIIAIYALASRVRRIILTMAGFPRGGVR